MSGILIQYGPGIDGSAELIAVPWKWRSTLNTMAQIPEKDGKPLPPFKAKEQVILFGSYGATVQKVKGDKIWVNDGTVSYWVGQSAVSKRPVRH